MSSGPQIMKLPPAPRPVRNPVIAAALSLLLPGVGLLYLGAIVPALAMIGVWVALRPVLAVLLALGAIDVGPWYFADLSLDAAMRVVAGVISLSWARRTMSAPLPVVPPGVYGLTLLASLLLRMLASTQLQKVVPVVELSADAFGLRQGEYVQVRRVPPATGVLAVYLLDVIEAGPQHPTAPIKRDAYVGRIIAVSSGALAIEGRDASVPSDDFLGEALGVILSNRPDGGGLDWSRVGRKPTLESP